MIVKDELISAAGNISIALNTEFVITSDEHVQEMQPVRDREK